MTYDVTLAARLAIFSNSDIRTSDGHSDVRISHNSDVLPQASTPEIHVHIPSFGSPSQPRTTLTDRAGHNRINLASHHGNQNVIELTDSDHDDAPLLSYPPISQVLQDLHAVMPLLNYPQYEAALVSSGIIYVNSVAHIDRSFFVDIIHMPEGAVGDFCALQL